MFNHLIACLTLGIILSPVCGADEPNVAVKESSWGHVSGQVILEGKLDDPRLQKYFEDLLLSEPLSQKQARQGVEARILNQIPNESLIVDAKSRGVKNAIVYLKTRPEKVHPDFARKPLAPVELKYENRLFNPRIFALQVGQTLRMTADKINGEGTNFLADFMRNDNLNVLVAADGPAFQWVPKHPEPLPRAICSTIYLTARGYFIIQDHPYITLTDQQGRFELKNLPAGTHELVIWHETVGYVAKKLVVEVKPNETQQIAPKAIKVEQLVR